ncbi:IS200/IS605 family transposase [Gracilimonas sp.]|uniref:IS200/IS605 family transposase n=1 Tax=Gracilimonas sp. TaxID=1974203 RepID=UPI002871DB45|nr:IS200/IS605 family transposase [Gracilimonas sp.]
MSTYTQLLYQLDFSTKERKPALTKPNRKELYKYLWGILKNKNCHLYRINGVENHLHIITHIHPTIGISSLIKDLKTSSSRYIKEKQLFSDFTNWQDGYGAFSYSIKAKDRLIEYVKNQEEHHKEVSFREEYIALLKEHEIEFNERYLF